jgi:hypothetical protein
VGESLGGALDSLGRNTTPAVADIAGGVVAGLTSVAVRAALGGEVTTEDVLADVFQNAIGNSLSRQVDQPLTPQERREQFLADGAAGVTDDEYEPPLIELADAPLEEIAFDPGSVPAPKFDLEPDIFDGKNIFAGAQFPSAVEEAFQNFDQRLVNDINAAARAPQQPTARAGERGLDGVSAYGPFRGGYEFAPEQEYPQISSVMATPNSVKLGRAYRTVEGFSLNLAAEPQQATSDTYLQEYRAYPGMGVRVSSLDEKGLSTGFGIFTDQQDASGSYFLREATREEAIGIQQAWKSAGDEVGQQLMVAGAVYYAAAVLDAGLAALPLRPRVDAVAGGRVGIASAAADAEAGGATLVGVPVTRSANPLAAVREFDAYGNEIMYRTMSPGDATVFVRTGQIPGTGETSLSPVQNYSQGYDGVTFRITVKPGTSAELQQMAVAANSGTTRAFPSLAERSGPWNQTNARFKVESGQTTTQLGKGSALRLFNSNIIKYDVVRPNTVQPRIVVPRAVNQPLPYGD